MFRLATNNDVGELQKILVNAYQVTYADLYSDKYIDQIINEYYNIERLIKETSFISKEWSGYYVLVIGNKIVGCIGGGVGPDNRGEIYVLYLDPLEKGKGYGSILVDNLTALQKQDYGITTQLVNVAKGNMMAIPFYKKKGFIQTEVKRQYFSSIEDDYKSIVMVRRV